ncbi:MAG: MerR family transcriptional regulator [Anaerolineae bacterium]|jgi:DNA-binding transcriptional MerR regulator|nr:MerR family transcriptional regulator [Anaerolineae bacterium]
MLNDQELFTISQVAEITGLSVHTLRYYERIGLIRPIDRAGNTHRRYSSDDIGWVEFLLKLRATGMAIQNMKTYAELQRAGEETLEERVEMLKTLQFDVKAHIHELNEHLELIRHKIEFYSAVIAGQKQETSA